MFVDYSEKSYNAFVQGINATKRVSKKVGAKVASGFGLTATGIAAAHAEVPASATTAITTAGTDVVTVGSAVFVVIVGIFAIKLLRKAL